MQVGGEAAVGHVLMDEELLLLGEVEGLQGEEVGVAKASQHRHHMLFEIRPTNQSTSHISEALHHHHSAHLQRCFVRRPHWTLPQHLR